MNSQNFHAAPQADLIVESDDGRTVLVVEVKSTKFKDEAAKQGAIAQLQLYLTAANLEHPFAMLVDLDEIQIFQGKTSKALELVGSLKTNAVLSYYDPEFGTKQIFWYYLETLVEAWLRDLAYHWKTDKPPASEQLSAIGLLQHLEGGTTKTEAELGAINLYRN